MKHLSRLLVGSLIVLAAVALSLPRGSMGAEDKYPHVDVAVGYAVDPAWPQKPSGFTWAEMSSIAVDSNDNVYLVTRANPPVQVYDASGKFIRSWGQDTIKTPHHMKIDHEGNIWITDIGYHTVQKYDSQGKLLLTIGTKGEAGRDKTHLNQPTDIAITPKGDVFVSDGYGNARVVHFDRTGKFVNEWGELGSKPGQFSIPHAICVDSKGRLYVADRNNVRVQVFDQTGKLLDVWNNVITPWGFCVTAKDEIWVCGSSPMRWRKEDSALGCPPKDQVFMKFNGDGKLLQLWTVPKGADGLERPGELNWVHCIAEDSKGNLYAGDIKGKKAQKFVRQQ
jgi:hypothetical protein